MRSADGPGIRSADKPRIAGLRTTCYTSGTDQRTNPVSRIVFSPQILPKTVVDLARSMAPAGFDLTIADPGTAAFNTAVRDAEYFLGFVRGGMDDAFFK